MTAREYNFDGLVGPTHNYAGLSWGNVASAKHQNATANPRAAALEGLAKMRRVAALGIGQAVLPPLARPNLCLLRDLGFRGSPGEMIERAGKSDPVLLAAAYSASSMWTANAATVSPAADCADGRTHFTPANLATLLHRSAEAADTTRVLRAVFRDESRFAVHDPLPGSLVLCDEGAANHTRLCSDNGQRGIELFAWGRSGLDRSASAPERYPARQTAEASHAIARRHGLDLVGATLFWQQLPAAIDAGVFHNDVISVGHGNVLLVHELAFVDQARCLDELRRMWDRTCSGPLHIVQIAARDLPLADTVSSYLFNSQLLSRPDGGMTLLCPQEVAETAAAQAAAQQILAAGSPVDDLQFADLRQSMRNGGGPACLRLRVVLDEADRAACAPGVFWSDTLDRQLTAWVEKHYRESLSLDDLRDPKLIDECLVANESLAMLLQLDQRAIPARSASQ
jgi:succinylarginine dihydrolase